MSDAASPFRVALTFDVEFPDRPTEPGVTARILDVLGAAGVRATMFVQGRWAEAEPGLTCRIADEGHRLGNHSHHHARMTLFTGAGITHDVLAAERAITDAAGVSPAPWFRCPFGAGARSRRVLDRLAAVGYTDVGWHVDGNDWAAPSPGRLEARLRRGVLTAGDGSIVLLHGWPTATPVAVARLVPALRDRGATFVTVDELRS